MLDDKHKYCGEGNDGEEAKEEAEKGFVEILHISLSISGLSGYGFDRDAFIAILLFISRRQQARECPRRPVETTQFSLEM